MHLTLIESGNRPSVTVGAVVCMITLFRLLVTQLSHACPVLNWAAILGLFLFRRLTGQYFFVLCSSSLSMPRKYRSQAGREADKEKRRLKRQEAAREIFVKAEKQAYHQRIVVWADQSAKITERKKKDWEKIEREAEAESLREQEAEALQEADRIAKRIRILDQRLEESKLICIFRVHCTNYLIL